MLDAGLDCLAVELAIERDLRLIPLLDGLNTGKLEHSGKVLLYHAFKSPDGNVMSDGSQLPDQYPLRPLRSNERELVQELSRGMYSESEIERQLAHALVHDVADGGMGSIRFANSSADKSSFGREAAEADYVDQDGVVVKITLNLDRDGGLFEVDFWKVDFSPLLRYPQPHDLKMLEITPSTRQKSEPALASRP